MSNVARAASSLDWRDRKTTNKGNQKMLSRSAAGASKLQLLVTLFLVLSLIGCTSMQVSQGEKLPSALADIQPGDTVTIATYSGNVIKLKVTSIDVRALAGQSDEKVVSIPVIQIKSVAKSKFSAVKTIGFTAAIFYVLLATLVVIGFYEIGKSTK